MKAWPRRSRESTKTHPIIWPEAEERLCRELLQNYQRWVRFDIRTGLRVGETRALRWGWISESGVLIIPAAFRKQRKDYRLALTPEILSILGPRGRPEEKVFPGLMSTGGLNQMLKRAARRAGLEWWERLSCHSLRHSWVARLQRAGVQEERVQKLGGWATRSVLVQHYYPAVEDDEARGLLERIGTGSAPVLEYDQRTEPVRRPASRPMARLELAMPDLSEEG